MKPQNILIDENDNVVICDWGLSRFMQTNDNACFTNLVQTLWYRSPELLLGQPNYNIHIDIWSFGIIMGELYNGSVMFQGDCERDQLYKFFKCLVHHHPTSWPGVDQLEEYCTSFPHGKNNL